MHFGMPHKILNAVSAPSKNKSRVNLSFYGFKSTNQISDTIY